MTLRPVIFDDIIGGGMKISLSQPNTAIKRQATRAFFDRTEAKPREKGVDFSLALIMAGVPGAGKTEYISSFIEENVIFKDNALRIDLDEIITVFEEYQPEEDSRFRSIGSRIVENILDRAFKGGYNFILDGTFAGAKAIDNVHRAIRHGYLVYIVVLIEDIEQAKEYTRIRKEKTKREIKDEAFGEIIAGIRKNLKTIQSNFINKGLPVVVEFIEKRWQEGTVRYERRVWPNIDDLYEK